jgi:signal transduction histidine kinase
MIEQLAVFASEVTRVAREVGTEGKLGGRAQVKGVSGVWRELTESVNQMAGNLTAQVRNIADVTIAVASGDLSKKITVDVRGEILQLQVRQNELQRTNEELAAQARLLAEQNAEVERKSVEVEYARHALEEKAAELTRTAKYKSEFLANMCHELRTPLNSIIVLSQQLAEHPGGLSDKQIEFCRNINSSGADLLHLINDILDLSKIESGTVTVEVEEIPFTRIKDSINRTFRHLAEAKNLPFHVEFSEKLPKSIESDLNRLQQILKNLLSNAIKFTSEGHVNVRVDLATEGWSPDHQVLREARQVAAFTVEDTGIGIAPEKQRLVFEAFQQADAGTSRQYGGTGLGLAISRELTSLLGGEIKLASAPRKGSVFTLYLPLRYLGSNPGQNPGHFSGATLSPPLSRTTGPFHRICRDGGSSSSTMTPATSSR